MTTSPILPPAQPELKRDGKLRNGAPRYRNLAPFRYMDVEVPIDFESDLFTKFFGSSIVVDSAVWRDAKAAPLVHDYCINQNHPRANDYFSELLKIYKVPAWRRWLIVTFVRWWTV